MWGVRLQVDAPKSATVEVDLEQDDGYGSWKKVPQSTNLITPLPVHNVRVSPASAPTAAQDPSKKSKKRKSHE